MLAVDHAEDTAVGTLVRVIAGQEHSAIGFDRQKAFDYLKGFERMVGEYDVALVDRRTWIDEYAITGFERRTHRIALDPQSEPPAQQHIEPLAKSGNRDLVAHRNKRAQMNDSMPVTTLSIKRLRCPQQTVSRLLHPNQCSRRTPRYISGDRQVHSP